MVLTGINSFFKGYYMSYTKSIEFPKKVSTCVEGMVCIGYIPWSRLFKLHNNRD